MQREQICIPKVILYVVYALVFYAVQSSLFGAWSIRGFHLDLMPAFVAAAAVLDGPMEGVILGVTVGLLYDLGFTGMEGAYPVFFLLYGLFAGVFSRLALSRNYISVIMLNAVQMLLLGLIRYFFYLLPRQGASFGLVLQQIVGGLLLASVLCFVVYVPMRKISDRFFDR